MEKSGKNQGKPYYSTVLKRQVVREYELGLYTKEALSVKYGILGSNTVLVWQKQYSTLANENAEKKPAAIMNEMKRQGKKEIIEAQNTPKPIRSVEQDRISELEKQLAQSRQREQLYLRVIEISSEEIGEDLLKKTGIGLSKSLAQKGG